MKTIQTIILIIILALLSIQRGWAITVGDKVPDLVFRNIVNYSKTELKLSDIKGKVVIIDFFGRSCGSCLKKMPLMAELQAKYQKDVFVILSSEDSKKNIEAFYNRRKDLKALKLPISADSTDYMKQVFPYYGLPHLIWIGKDGKVKAITAGEDMNDENLAKLISTNEINLPVKNDWIGFDYHASFKEAGIETSDAPFFESHMVNYQPGLVGQVGNTRTKDGIRIFGTNSSIASLYAFAYRFEEDLNPIELPVRCVFENRKDSLKIFPKASGDPVRRGENLKCYELMMPASKEKNAEQVVFKVMQEDLDRYLYVKSKIITIKRDCFVLTNQPDQRKSNTDSSYCEEGIDYTTLHNQSLEDVVMYIRSSFATPLPIVTDDKDARLTIKLKNSYSSWDDLEPDVIAAGIKIKTEPKDIRMIKFFSL